METIKIPFTGINRSIDDGASTDGQTMELINARIKNGMVEPIAKPLYIGAIPVEVDKMYYHSNAKKYVGVNTSSGQLYAINEDLSSYTTITQASDIQDVAFLGNVLCISDDNGLEYAFWNGTTYDFLGLIPELPNINIGIVVVVDGIIPDATFLTGIVSNGYDAEQFKQTAQYSAAGYFDNLASLLNKEYKGAMCGCSFLVRYGYRASSGKYIKVSPPILAENNSYVTHSFKTGTGTSTQIKSVSLNSFNPFAYVLLGDEADASVRQEKYGFAAAASVIGFSFDVDEYLYQNWGSLITSIDVFVSPVRWVQKKTERYFNRASNAYVEVEYDSYEFDDSDESILNKSYIFYKVSEYNLKGENTWSLDDWSIDNLSLQEKLDESNSIYNELSANKLYVYNSRLHAANISENFYKGNGEVGIRNEAEKESGIKKDVDIFTYIKTEAGVTIVKKSISQLDTFISPLITYPDTRAYKMVFRWKNEAEEFNYYSSKEFILKKHPYLNYSYYFKSHPSRNSKNEDNALYIDYTSEPDNLFTTDILEQNTTINRPNILKVSELNDPITFPAAQTYNASQGVIIGMQSNTTALSQGQFGQYPLYVFSSDGIYAMQVDTSGETVYSTQSPVSRDVCVNSNSIAGIDNAVVFASKRGLMAISGTTVTLLSADMDGYLPSCIDSSPIIPKIAKVASFENALSTATFNDYIENAFVSYNYQENELIVTNPDYAYAYVYNMNSASWAKISPNPRFFVNRYPECYGVIDGVLYDMQNNNRTITTLLVLTKPIKMGTLTHKRILQSALRGVVKRALSDLYLRGEPVMFRGESLDIFSDVGLYILGSNDAEHFTLVSGKESIVDIRDLVTKMNKSKAYKYFMVALAGGVRTDVSLNYMEFIASESFTNRLR